jgi:hypothetical protein
MGFKVQVTDAAGGLRVVGIFPDEAIAKAWFAADKAGGELDAESVASSL